jgi:putative phosphoribosyl transferase
VTFKNRADAGRFLGERLRFLSKLNPIIVALPRGGVSIGYEVAQALKAPLEILVVRKIGAPFNPEFGIGAITEGGYYWINADAVRSIDADAKEIERTAMREFEEVKRRTALYRNESDHPSISTLVSGRNVLVVDDGLATGVTAKVACRYLKGQGAHRVIFAAPACAPDTAASLRSEVDNVICIQEPEDFYAVGQFYEDFEQITDDEVISLLTKAQEHSSIVSNEVTIEEAGIKLPGSVAYPQTSLGFVIFAHGSGSSRLSPRNQQIARALNDAGFGTLLFDLLTEEESLDRSNVFDIRLLAKRLVLTTRWARKQPYARTLPIAYFGASTGAAAALWAAAMLDGEISAIVSRGGRPDLAIPKLAHVTAPTLLIVGGNDEAVIEMNEEALKYLVSGELIIIPGATHLFEEEGALEQVAEQTISWLQRNLEGEAQQTAA